MSDIKYTSDSAFEADVLKSDEPGAGRLLGRMVRPVQDDRADPRRSRQGVPGQDLKVAKLNIDENQATPAKYGIRGIPTLMLFKNGAVEAPRSARSPNRS